MKFAMLALSLMILPMSANALPEGMSQALAEAKQSYAKLSEKEADEISEKTVAEDDKISFFASLGLGGMFEAVQSADETTEYHVQTVKDLAWTFKVTQLEALLEATRNSDEKFNSDREAVKRDLTMIDLALQYKKNKLNDASLKAAVSDRLLAK